MRRHRLAAAARTGTAVECGTTAAAMRTAAELGAAATATAVHAATDLGAAATTTMAAAPTTTAVVPLRVSAARQDERQGRCHCKFLHWLTSLILTGACRSFTCENANDRDALPEPIMFVSLSERSRPNGAKAASSHRLMPFDVQADQESKGTAAKAKAPAACATTEALGQNLGQNKHTQRHEQTFSVRNVPANADRTSREDRTGHKLFDIKNRAIAAKTITTQTTMVTMCLPGSWAFGFVANPGSV